MNFQVAALDPKTPRQVGAARKSDTDAIVRDKVLRRFGFAALREICRRTGDDNRQFVGNAYRNHVAFNLLAEPNAGIETLGDDVGQRLVEGQVQRNFRVLREKSQNSGAQKKSPAGGGAVTRNMPAGLPRNSFVDSNAD